MWRGASSGTSNQTFANPTFTGVVDASGASYAKGLPFILAVSNIPFICPSTGSIGNNGALSGLTALLQTYSGGAYTWFDINTIAAGVPAGWYWTVYSSGTAATIYNSQPSATYPIVAGTTTAFSTTGPGAFTGSTNEIFLPSITIPAGAMGANGEIFCLRKFNGTNSAGTKRERLRWTGSGGTDMGTGTNFTTTVTASFETWIANTGATNAQYYGRYRIYSGASTLQTPVAATSLGAIDTTAATTIVPSMQRNTATDNYVMESIYCELRRAT